MKLTISKGNSKLGGIPNLSLPPIKTCCAGVPCAKKCYAMKSYRMYPNVKKAWDGNLKLWQKNPILFENYLRDYLSLHWPKFFRYQVGGDLPDLSYLYMIRKVAFEFPETQFLVYTKRIHMLCILGNRDMPKNLQVFLSRWPGDSVAGVTAQPGWELPSWANQAWMLDPKNPDTRIPPLAFMCPGSCKTCKHCYTTRQDVVFKQH